MTRSIELNRAHWDERAPAPAASPDYAVQQFVEDPAFLSHVVRFDRERLGDISAQRAVHLQCHIGTDTISLARLGARITGLDFSGPALEQARELARRTRTEAGWVQADVYDALSVLDTGRFDLVYTGVGALCWLPRIEPWARVVAALLAPGGRLFVRDGHPMLWALDVRDGRIEMGGAYFEHPEPWIDDRQGSYVATEQPFTHTLNHSWNHGLGEIITALQRAGLILARLEEHDSVPWEALPGQMELLDNGEWRLRDRPWRLPHSYTLQATKDG